MESVCKKKFVCRDKEGYVDNRIFHLAEEDIPVEIREPFSSESAVRDVQTIRWVLSDVVESGDEKIFTKSLLNSGQEETLFLAYNYARKKKTEYKEAHNGDGNSKIRDDLVARIREVKSPIAQANMGLVFLMAKRINIPYAEHEELVSEGNVALLNCVDKFDVSLGYKFSTYACRGIIKAFQRTGDREAKKYARHFDEDFDEGMAVEDSESSKSEIRRIDDVELMRDIIGQNLADLSEIEFKMLVERFDFSLEGQRTLEKVAKINGVSKERVRQVLRDSYAKIRNYLVGNVKPECFRLKNPVQYSKFRMNTDFGEIGEKEYVMRAFDAGFPAWRIARDLRRIWGNSRREERLTDDYISTRHPEKIET